MEHGPSQMEDLEMELGAFSVSLNVKDLEASRAFYEILGFTQTGGDGEHYLILANGTTIIGIFHEMFEDNILTFNPGLNQAKELLSDFTDVRAIRAKLVEAGIELTADTEPDGTGPAHIALLDPDGNALLIDQFFPKPGTEAE